jgi:hypothetical protein
MPAQSKAFQRLAGAALAGASFPMAHKLRDSMTATQLRAFASGPMAGKPDHTTTTAAAPRRPHPAVAARARQVKASHAHLSRTVRGFRSLSGREQLQRTQAHVTASMGRGKR